MGASRVVLRASVMRCKRGCKWPFIRLNIPCPPLLTLPLGYTVMTYQESMALGIKVGMTGEEAIELMR